MTGTETATGAPLVSHQADAGQEITHALNVFKSPGDLIEIRTIDHDAPKLKSGYYRSIEDAAAAAIKAEKTAKGVYFVFNEIRPDFPGGSSLRSRREMVGNMDIARRRWILIDVDPERSTGTNSTDDEKTYSRAVLDAVIDFLSDAGYPAPVITDSGNGHHCYYRIDLPNDTESAKLVKNFLRALDDKFSMASVAKVDIGNNNAGRITKLPGTMTRKGPDTQGRPHRRSRLLEVPDPIETITREQIEAIAALYQTDQPKKAQASHRAAEVRTESTATRREIIEAFNQKIPLTNVLDRHCKRDGDRWLSPFSKGGEAGISLFPDDLNRFYTHHNSDPEYVNDEHSHSAYDALVAYGHGGDEKKALAAACEMVGMTLQQGTQSGPEGPGSKGPSSVPGITNTDAGNSQRLLTRYGEDVRYCTENKTWHIWNGKCWEADTTDRMLRLADKTAKAIYTEAEDNATGRELAGWGKKSESLKARRNMIEGAGPYVAVKPEGLNAFPMLLNCKNGTLELDTMTFREHRREDLLTFTLKADYLPGEKCPLWEQHITKILKKDTELINFFQEMCGYSLFFGEPEQIFFILHGNGKNGKSVTVSVLSKILGEYAATADVKSLMPQRSNGPRSDILRLDKKRMVTTTEPGEGMPLDEAMIKALTGGDTITIRGLYQSEREITPGFIIWMSTNHAPLITGTDEGIRRRPVLVPFNYTIPKDDRIPDYDKQLLDEGSGILNWCLDGLKRYQARGRLDRPEIITAATESYLRDNDPVGAFLDEMYIIDPQAKGEEYRVRRKDVSDRFTQWCKDEGWEEVLPRKFAQRLRASGIQDGVKISGGRSWQGLKLAESNGGRT
ncbi:phage/plasmid primase, P4 family [Methanogenium sp. MK-MG]|uniref:DNA primase family protein n=1 Tax=Methanogenium sp. MK-MG TaxID=2599926 RepID=UPI0013EDACF6|nr:phage/plasmid primase, P4 family [Methanogenium sp. MK-MG]KAF1075958.1 hypothetical protein MKMG_01588 [Methanogenium sp. MK-MG]